MELQGSTGCSLLASPPTGRRRAIAAQGLCALLLGAASLVALPALAQATRGAQTVQPAAAAHPTRAYWNDVRGTPASTSARGAEVAIQPDRFRALNLDKLSLAAMAATAPLEFSTAARQRPLVLTLPDPAGNFQRFNIVDSPVMEPALAAKHPNIRTYSGRGIDDPTANLRMSITPLGVQVSVRSAGGAWYIDSYYRLDESLYVSYFRKDLRSRRPQSFAEPVISQPLVSLDRGRYHAASSVDMRAAGFKPGAQVTITVRNKETDAVARQTLFATADADGSVATRFKADPYKNLGSYEVTASDGRSSSTMSYQVVGDGENLNAAVGSQLRTYRLAMTTDPAYATYFGGGANVTAAKVALINRVTQVYEYDSAIRMVLIGNNDALNLDTAAQATGANGPCGAAACFTAAQVGGCSSSGLSRNRIVTGLLVGASNYDVGHLALGGNGGGIASLGVVGLDNKAQGCTGINPPIGDAFAIDFVAHEFGHQFAGNHTFNGTQGNCSGGNRSAPNSVEPGSGSSIMAYAGICGTDNLQANSDPYWSQRSLDEIVNHTSAAELTYSELQQAALRGFTVNGQEFRLRYNGADSAPIVRGTNFSAVGIKAAAEAIAGWPVGGTVTILAFSDGGFTVTYGGTLASIDIPVMQVVGCTAPCVGYMGEIRNGGLSARRGTVTATGNSIPAVTVASSQFTIPVQTPFALTGSGTDADGDVLTYMWEQTDRGAGTGTTLTSNTKLNGPLFRMFGSASSFNASLFAPPGQNNPDSNPTRVFPDIAQIVANNTNAESGSCPAAPAALATTCFSEFLPTSAYVGFAGVNASPPSLNFKLTARDGSGGVNSATTQLVLAPGAGPFLVTAPNAAGTLNGASMQTVTWAVANTNAAPVNAANVKISLSTDGGSTYPVVLAASTPNDGSQAVMLPNTATSMARVKVEAVGNVFFDISNANFTIRLTGDADGDGAVTCADLSFVRLSVGKVPGDLGYDARADVDGNGRVDVRDVAYVSQRIAAGTICPRR